MSENSTPPNPTAPPRRRAWLKRLGWAALWFLTAVAILITFENWRGRRAFERLAAECKAAGDDLSPAALIPPPIPDAENFGTAPIFQPLFDSERASKPGEPVRWKNEAEKKRLENLRFPIQSNQKSPVPTGGWRAGKFTDVVAWQSYFRGLTNVPVAPQPQSPGADILLALTYYDRDYAAVREAAARPKTRFPVRYEDNFAALLPHLSLLRTFAQVAQFRAIAQLAEANSAGAANDLLLALRLAESLDHEPLLISQLVRIAILEQASTPLWEGLARHQWSDAELAQFEQRLAPINFAASAQLALRGERSLGIIAGLDTIRNNPKIFNAINGNDDSALPARLAPSAFVDHSKVVAVQFLNESIAAIDPVAHRFDNKKPDEIEKRLEDHRKHILRHPYSIFATMLLPAVSRTTLRMASAQATIDLARIAIALERHRLKHGALPEKLEALDAAVKLTGNFPRDVITGDAIHYQRTGEDRFLLHSTGWDGIDDGGKTAWTDRKETRVDFAKGDYVWPMPEK
jgi:hypothetical protein